MHTEYISVSRSTLRKLIGHNACAIAVGTTSVRTLESLYHIGVTQIIIAPGYDYKIVKAMITNFHQPQSTLLLLVSAFVKGNWRTIYNYALSHDFRFLSYGDSSLLIP